jgi:peptidoglycan hydrolase-like protein with peptidoglycan-binding domain
MGNRIVLLAVGIGLAFAASICADDYRLVGLQEGWGPDNVRAVQEKLRESGLYFGEIDGTYTSELAAALGRYQIRNGLPITGQLDVETSKALGTQPAVTASTPNDQRRTSETWERLRKSDQQFPGKTVWPAPSQSANETGITTGLPPRSAPAATAAISVAPELSTERLRDYVAAFVLAGLDPQVGSEADFFADRVQYYDDGLTGRDKIRKDLQQYVARWPQRRLWLDGDITVEPESYYRVRVTFPLRYELRNRGKHSSGKVDKTLVLDRIGDDLQIVAVNERKAK